MKCYNEIFQLSQKYEQLFSMDFFSKNLMKRELNKKEHYLMFVQIIEEIFKKNLKSDSMTKKHLSSIIELFLIYIGSKNISAVDFIETIGFKFNLNSGISFINKNEMNEKIKKSTENWISEKEAEKSGYIPPISQGEYAGMDVTKKRKNHQN